MNKSRMKFLIPTFGMLFLFQLSSAIPPKMLRQEDEDGQIENEQSNNNDTALGENSTGKIINMKTKKSTSNKNGKPTHKIKSEPEIVIQKQQQKQKLVLTPDGNAYPEDEDESTSTSSTIQSQEKLSETAQSQLRSKLQQREALQQQQDALKKNKLQDSVDEVMGVEASSLQKMESAEKEFEDNAIAKFANDSGLTELQARESLGAETTSTSESKTSLGTGTTTTLAVRNCAANQNEKVYCCGTVKGRGLSSWDTNRQCPSNKPYCVDYRTGVKYGYCSNNDPYWYLCGAQLPHLDDLMKNYVLSPAAIF